jgi:di/tricarboxylate transporter
MPTFASGGVATIAPKMPPCRSTGMGPGGVKFGSTSSTGKIGTTGCPFVCTGMYRLTEDAA